MAYRFKLEEEDLGMVEGFGLPDTHDPRYDLFHVHSLTVPREQYPDKLLRDWCSWAGRFIAHPIINLDPQDLGKWFED